MNLDSHTDVLLPATDKRYYDKDGTSQTSLVKLLAGGIDVVAFAVAVGPGPRDAAGVAAARAEADAKLAAIRSFLDDSNGAAAPALSVADIEANFRAGKVSVITSFLNARALGTELGGIDAFYRQGVRVFGFNHAGNNDWADSSRPGKDTAEEHHGLSALGKKGVARLNQLGVIIDVSQLTTAATLQVLQLSRAPDIASHSDVRALVDNTRNLGDAELDAIAKAGGVVQVTPFNPYLAPKDAEATLADYVDHIEYIVKRIGIDHVGVGTDFNHGSGIDGFRNESEAPNVTRELLRRDYSQEQIGKIWGGNFLRVFRAVEAAAGKKRTAA